MLILDVNPAEDPCSQRLFTKGRAAGRRYRLIFWATIRLALMDGSGAVYSQQTKTASAVARTRSLHCQHPADPQQTPLRMHTRRGQDAEQKSRMGLVAGL